MSIASFCRNPSAKCCTPRFLMRLSRRLSDLSFCKNRKRDFYIIDSTKMKITVLYRNMTAKCCTFLPEISTDEIVNVMIDYKSKKINMKEIKKESKLLCLISINKLDVVLVHL
jgi:hypothetical protein